MYSLVVMAAFATAPEMDAGLFGRRRNNCCAPACCAPVSSCCAPSCCDAGAAPGTAAPAPGGAAPAPMPAPAPGNIQTPPKKLPKTVTSAPTPAPAPATGAKAAAGGTVAIPADLKTAIDASEQKQQIYDYLNNQSVPLEQRQQFLNTVRQQLLPASTGKK